MPGRAQHRGRIHAVRLDERGDRLRPDPDHPARPDEHRGRVAHLGERELRAADHLADGTTVGRGRGAIDRLRPGQRGRHGPVGIGRHDDDRQGAAGPGEVGQAADPGLAERVRERPLDGRGQDDGGDGHDAECSGAKMPGCGSGRIRGTIRRPARDGEPRRPCPKPRPRPPPSRPAPTCATSRSSPTSTTARPRSSTRCSARPARSGPTRPSSTGSWIRATSSARRGSRSSPSRRPSTTPASGSTSSTRRVTPTSAARWSARC